MYAVVEYKGNQYKAEKDAVLTVSKINDAKAGDTVTIDKVLLVSDGDKVSVGTPYVQGAKVTVEVGETFRDKKVLVFKYKSKKDYHRLHGHREEYTNVTVKDVVLA
ncbi:MAG: 50S ribosomal protein L21 [Treponema sp.]|nr:50S ribosomal protein L21 [Treponema sp.]